MLKQLMNETEAVAKVKDIVLDLQGNRWMIAFWKVEEGTETGKNTLSYAGRVSWMFPVGDYVKCVKMLKEDMDREVNVDKPPVPAPLDVADWLKVREISTNDDMEEVEIEEIEPDEIDKLFNPTEGE